MRSLSDILRRGRGGRGGARRAKKGERERKPGVGVSPPRMYTCGLPRGQTSRGAAGLASRAGVAARADRRRRGRSRSFAGPFGWLQHARAGWTTSGAHHERRARRAARTQPRAGSRRPRRAARWVAAGRPRSAAGRRRRPAPSKERHSGDHGEPAAAAAAVISGEAFEPRSRSAPPRARRGAGKRPAPRDERSCATSSARVGLGVNQLRLRMEQGTETRAAFRPSSAPLASSVDVYRQSVPASSSPWLPPPPPLGVHETRVSRSLPYARPRRASPSRTPARFA